MDEEIINIPTLYDWAGGMPAFEKLMTVFYQKVLHDELLAPVFKHMSADHQLHVAHFIAEVFGGPKMYSGEGGSHFKMIQNIWVNILQKRIESVGLNY
ncbi:globin domain-containing protein [Chitinophaga sancti]|uniref:Globin n=1 Tax=Chitinophaga sancti TaxID=1004 RepID=A0A1K1QYU0_9BACT|nr:hypothetical protein [Chitinophaga sancti]WQD62109.1 hypothetical protein U0033_29910 [Chitinophaga sancti]WQG92322.1 hypothetical protein SR876_12475 [Chitinophaga sancti]SFW65106.1 globin [Chitinophaga sancti]